MSKTIAISVLLEDFESKREEILSDLNRVGAITKEAVVRAGATDHQVYWEWAFNSGRMSVNITAYADEQENVSCFDVSVDLEPDVAHLFVSQKLDDTESLVKQVFEWVEGLTTLAKAVIKHERH